MSIETLLLQLLEKGGLIAFAGLCLYMVKLTLEMRTAREQQIAEESKGREDRMITVVQENTKAMVGLQNIINTVLVKERRKSAKAE